MLFEIIPVADLVDTQTGKDFLNVPFLINRILGL